jgi:serine/threonine protein kinase/Flp pilus assembly protein TadD
MGNSFQVDKFHFNNHLGTSILGDRYSGFRLEDQSKALGIVFNEETLSAEQLAELQRVTLILAQQENESVLRPQAWGSHNGRHYAVWPDFGRPLSGYENLKALSPAELLLILRKLLRALCFAEAKEVNSHNFIHPANIAIALESSEVKLGFFGCPLIELAQQIRDAGDPDGFLNYFPPESLDALGWSPQQYDLYALGLIALELATAESAESLLLMDERLDASLLRERVSAQGNLPLPVVELFYKLLTPVLEERYVSYQQALDDVVSLAGHEESGLSFQTFILDTLVNGRFKLGKELARGRVSQVYSAIDLRDDESRPCVIKLIDLRQYSEMAEVFHTKFKQLSLVHHEHVLEVYDVGVHFENGYIAMESGLISLEDLLIKRGTLPLTDAGRILFQLCKGLEGLHFNQIPYHGAIKPSNVFLTTDLHIVKLGDALVADYFLRHDNLNAIGAEYFNPEFIKDADCDVRSDLYSMGTLLFEMLVGHPPFSFKIEQEIIDDHLRLSAATRVESAMISPEAKDIILRLQEKNPAARYQKASELREELIVLLGYDKKEQVEVPNLFFDFAELNMVGKNAREKSEETLAIRLPAVHNRARGAIALLMGHGKEVGDASKAATSALRHLRELLFNPGQRSAEFAKLQKTEPEQFLDELLHELNERLYREAFGAGKTKHYGVSAVVGIVQENTLYMHQVGNVDYYLLHQGSLIDIVNDKWTVSDDLTIGDADTALSVDVHNRLGFGEMIKVARLKRRLKDGDQLVLVADALARALSVSEIRELVTSSSEPAQAIELVRSDAIRRRLEGTISCVLLNIGNVTAYAEETISHAKKGMLARNFLAQGDTFLNDGRIDEAIEQFNHALEINPNFAIIHHQLGVAYTRKGLMSYAISCFERALALNRKLAASYVETVKILEQQRRNREVLPLLREAIASGCKDSEVYALLGRELIRARNFDEAILYLSYTLEINPAHPTALRDRMIAIKRRNALDTKLLKMISRRQRLADDGKTRITQEAEVAEDE